ncbi:MAG TPA: error-prone DNA polymerase [Candidatus Binataceae bacterium]|nr:error-prone DNA polymerase [Candidatus Binataceae bacterium]
MIAPDYIELRARSAFSFLEGATTPEDLAERAAELGYPALALGDRDGVYGHPRFHQAATGAGIKPIVGAEVTLDDESRLYVLVPDRERYRNLCRTITASKLRILRQPPPAPDGTPSHPEYPAKGESRITLDDLERFGAGLICLAGGARSPLARALVRGENPSTLADRLGAIFGLGNFYIDIQRHLDADEERMNRRMRAFAEANRIPLTVSNDVCHAGPDRRLMDVLSCLRLKTTLEEAGRALWSNAERYLKPPTDIVAMFRDMPRAIAMTREIAARCEFTLTDLGYRFPDYPLPPGETPDSYLRALTYGGARERWGREISDRVRRQLEHELRTIEKLRLAGYFLIVWDIVQFCRENRIMAQGRGSAANSAVCYALGITAVDAVKMELLFERFLSEERGEWPDIDLDLPSGDQREKVIQYVYKRYSERGAAMTANVITYRTRSAMREVGKVLGFPSDQVDKLARLVQAYEFRDSHDDIVALMRRGGVDVAAPKINMLIDLVRRVQSLPRHLGQHSGGMVIGAGPLDEIVPLEPATMPGRVVVQWDKEDCADLGIIKIDLLGLGMLAALEQAIPMIREHEGVEIDLAHIPPDDPEVYAMLQRADTVGVFQVESRAQMATLPRMRPERFYDLVVEVAIIRPGPIVGKMVHPYLNRRNGREPVRYAHPALEPILRRTLGVPLFQEQLLRIAMTAAGFTGGEAEELRRAMGFKRSVERMEKIEQRLRDGMARKGIDGAVADDIVRSITSFALYGFPESHAASFALIAYASAYLKCHHPAAFYASILNCYPMGFYHPSTLVKDAQHHGVIVLPIDVSRSNWECTLERAQPSNEELVGRASLPVRDREEKPLSLTRERVGERVNLPSPLHPHPREAHPPRLPSPVTERARDKETGKGQNQWDRRPCLSTIDPPAPLAIRLGLKYVSGLREDLGRRIESERARWAFQSIADLSARIAPSRRDLDALAYAGALSCFGLTRREALWQAAAVERDPQSLLAGVEPRRDTVAPLPAMTQLEGTAADYEATGVTTGPHVMAHLRDRLRTRGVLSAADLADAKHGAWVKIAGVVIVRQRPGTAKGFLFITMEDETGLSNAIVTPDVFQNNRSLLHRASILQVEGWLQKQDGTIAVRGRRFAELRVTDHVPRSHDFR